VFFRIVVASRLLRFPATRPWARHPPPVGIFPSFLMSTWTSDPGVRVLVTPHRAAQLAAGGQVGVRQRRHPGPAQHPPDRGGVHPEPVPDPGRPPAAGAAQVTDPPLDLGPGPARAAAGPAGPVGH